ncbi:hypothetical protein Syun_004262 [Stephania yunnanensis]|uniref:Uncharacterized protein n=1 Tax=Stephania yunnanensis TaxID=152371 RepID=A0AAP0Q1A0_9MAGN
MRNDYVKWNYRFGRLARSVSLSRGGDSLEIFCKPILMFGVSFVMKYLPIT